MKTKHLRHLSLLTAAGALLAWAPTATAAEDLTLNTFDDDTSTAGFWLWWGGIQREITWDSTKDAGNNPASGAVKLSFIFDNTSGDNQYSVGMSLAGQSAYNGSLVVSPTEYSAIEFDLLWDPANTVTPEQINTGPDSGFHMGITPSGGWSQDWFTSVQTLEGGATWQRVTVPIPVTKPSFAGLVFKKWQPNNETGVSGVFNVWIDNIKLIASDAPPPVPEMTLNKSDAVGLQLTANGTGQYQRQNLAATSPEAQATWWVDNPEPVTYTMTLVDAPNVGAFQNHLFLVPDGAGGNSPDYSDPHAVFLDIRRNTDGTGSGTFRYKVNEPNGNSQIFGVGAIASLNVASPYGAWTLRFQNNTNITLTAPDGSSTNFNMLPEHAEFFRPAVTMTASFGIQPNQPDLIGLASTFGEFKITVGANTVLQDSFTTAYEGDQTPANPELWTRRMENVNGARILTGSGYFLRWGLPDTGFSLLASSNLNSGWYDLNLPGSAAGGTRTTFVAANDLPAGNNGFFVLQQRTATKLQVLLPGETAAPGTPTGKTGTPTPQQAGVEFTFTVNAVNDTWQRVNGVNDALAFTSSDEFAFFSANPALVNGTGTFSATFSAAGSLTITADNTTGTDKEAGTSSAVTVQ